MNRAQRRKIFQNLNSNKEDFKENFIKLLFYSKNEIIKSFFSNTENPSQIFEKIKKVFFPKELSIFCRNRFIVNKNLDLQQINQIYVFIIGIFSNDINQYIKYKYMYESYLTTEKYEEALKILEVIEKEICISYWSCCQKMMLTEMTKGFEENKKLMSLYSRSPNLIFNFLIEYKSFFVEKNTSYSAYQQKVKKALNTFTNEEIHTYFNYKLNIEKVGIDFNLSTIMQFETQFSIIDLYECYLQINTLEDISLEKDLIILANNINDFRLKNKLFLSNYNFLEINNLKNISYYKMLELYSNGYYEQFIEKATKYLEKIPFDFQIIILFIKAHIHQNYILNENSPAIYKCIYNIYKINENFNISINQIYYFLKIFSGNLWESKICSFISRKLILSHTQKNIFVSGINDYLIMPNLTSVFIQKENFNSFFKTFEKVCPITVNLYKYILLDEKVSLNEIKDYKRKNLFIADNLIKNKYFEEAYILLNKLKSNISSNDFYNIQKINKKFIKLFIDWEKYLDLICLIVNNYLVNKNLIKLIIVEELMEKIKKIKNHEMMKNINYVIFTFIYDNNDLKLQRIAYSNFMNYNSFHSLNDIISNLSSTKELIFFLEKICTVQLLKRDIILNPELNKTIEIRLNILRVLINLNPIQKKIYNEEITLITKQKSIKDRIKQIDQSRIYVDTENIKKENIDYLKEIFERFLNIKNFSNKIYIYDSNDYLETISNNQKLEPKLEVFSQDYIVFKEIFSKIMEEFLFNEFYGLNTYLSSRIRHGYCKNHLLSIFQSYNLLSKKQNDKSNEFQVNEYWDSKLLPNSKENIKFKNELSKFTKQVETKIEEVRSKWLCIKYRDKSEAFLDYTNCLENEHYFRFITEDVKDLETFYDNVIDALWNYTESNFELLREKINNELLESFIQYLSELEKGMETLNKEEFDYYYNIMNSIKQCQPQIKTKLKEFADLFHKRDVKYINFNMIDLIDTCTEINETLNLDFKNIKLEKNIIDNKVYKGDYFPYFVDILNILINNAIEHSKFSDISKLNLNILIKIEDDIDIIKLLEKEMKKTIINPNFLSITVSNNLSEELDIKILEQKIAKTFEDIKETKSFKEYLQTEGGTGFYKLNKTLRSNIPDQYFILYEFKERIFSIIIIIDLKELLCEV